ncbi:peroxiredoxin [Prolixibacter sp. NT017]|uniref:peroxiredoxin n=1 Tax=Prolixibacter sp. NT017 TaxID=2652390 RepID=UPI00126D6658|nr:peroxiredoxin [Prolixibacter sp. NT017]GET25315.1 peroxiredoxin [Prolixibacter sp. NT017]
MKKYMFISMFLCFLLAALNLPAEDSVRIPLIGEKAPSFTAQSTQGLIEFPRDFGRNWKIIFSHPRDFTPVCSSEIMVLAQMQKDFEDLGVKLMVISSDTLMQHHNWVEAMNELRYKDQAPAKINFPLIEDNRYVIARKYGMLHRPVSTSEFVRGVFVIDGKNIVRAVFFYPHSIGRNMDEIKRTVMALQTTDKEKVYTPANWHPGDDVLVPYFPYTDKELKENPSIADRFYNVGHLMHFRKE